MVSLSINLLLYSFKTTKLIKVFISRDLAPKSDFKKLLEARGLEVIGTSLIEFSSVAFNAVPRVDWIFFYSKNGVQYFFEGLRQPLPTNVKMAVIGKGTATALLTFHYTPDFIGTGEPTVTAQAFLDIARQQRVLFPRAKNSAQSVQQLLGGAVQIEDLVVYENRIKTDFQLPSCDYLVFTSPLNVKAYFDKVPYQMGQKIVAIGKTTALTLTKKGFSDTLIADAPTEIALAETLLLDYNTTY